MIRRIDALKYGCLKYVPQPVSPFQILVGANGTGKSTFLDAVRFLGQLVSEGLEAAIQERGANLKNLFWLGQGNKFELAVEMLLPENQRKLLGPSDFNMCRYEVCIGIDATTGDNGILAEKLLLTVDGQEQSVQRQLFSHPDPPPETILTRTPAKGAKTVINKVPGGNDNFYDETGKGWDHAFKLGPRKSALANLPQDETKFPVATWAKKALDERIVRIVLDSTCMRRPSPPGQPTEFKPDGSNIPWVIENLRRNEDAFFRWISHVQTAFPDLNMIKTVERPEDRHRYLKVIYKNGIEVPSWCVSDGTLRLLALTILASVGESGKVYLVEEPENGIHPQAVESVFRSLSSTHDCQILCTSHSPVVLSLAEPQQILCFAKSPDGATGIARGDDHPKLRDWKQGLDLGTLFAAGVLG